MAQRDSAGGAFAEANQTAPGMLYTATACVPHTRTHPLKRRFSLIKNHDIESLLNLFLILHPCYCLTVFEKNQHPLNAVRPVRLEILQQRIDSVAHSALPPFFLLTRIFFFDESRWNLAKRDQPLRPGWMR